MTRWARANSGYRKRPANPTPWDRLKNQASSGNSSADSDTHHASSKEDDQRSSGKAQSLANDPQHSDGVEAKKRKSDADAETLKNEAEATNSGAASSSNAGSSQGREVDDSSSEAAATRHPTKEVKEKGNFPKSVKNKLCFRCRKSGHVYADCPEADPQVDGASICFVCGSTEHKASSCSEKSTGDAEEEVVAYRQSDTSADAEVEDLMIEPAMKSRGEKVIKF